MQPRIHQNGQERKKGILNVCQLLLLTNTFSDFFVSVCSIDKDLLFLKCISNSWFGLIVVS